MRLLHKATIWCIWGRCHFLHYGLYFVIEGSDFETKQICRTCDIGYYKYITDTDIKEVIILDIFTMFNFTPYYDPSRPAYDMVANIISSFWWITKPSKGVYSQRRI